MKRIFLLIFCLALLLTGCGKEIKSESTIFAMDTVMTLEVWGEDAENATTQLAKRINATERTWSTTQTNSLISRMNRGEIQSLSEDEAALVTKVESLAERTHYAFNPRLRSLSLAWGFYHSENQDANFELPTESEIAAAIAEAQWDLGAVIKGYTGQECADLLSHMDVDRAILNLGGNTQTYGEKPNGEPWIIGIQNPDGGDALGLLSVSGTCSIVTSGDYQRYFEKDGVVYHHILDGKTGYPAETDLRSVTVICRDGMTADALSTALFVMGLEEAVEFWRQSDDFEAVFLNKDGKIYATEGANLSRCTYEVITR